MRENNTLSAILTVDAVLLLTSAQSAKLSELDISLVFFLRIRIQALNSLGAGPFSHTFKLKTKPLPPQPPRLECTAFSHQTLRLKWGDGPAKAATSDALQYQLQMGDRSGRSVAHYSSEGK